MDRFEAYKAKQTIIDKANLHSSMDRFEELFFIIKI